jgi:cytidylate kinase
MSELIITIDGPAGSGKSTVARLLAERLGATFLDTGAMYRAVTLAAVRDGVALSDEQQLVEVFERHRLDFEAAQGKMLASIDDQDVTEALRDGGLTAQVRYAASAPRVRERLVAMQRAFAAKPTKVVTEGRDQGTVVFPEANVKFYLTADATERARRRQAELDARGEPADLEQIRQAIEARDRSDENRAVGPLKPAPDAIVIDTTRLTVEKVVERVYRHVLERTQDGGQKTDDRGRKTEDRGQTTEDGGRASVAPRRQHRVTTDATDTSSATATAPRPLFAVPRKPSWHWLKVAWYWLARFGCQIFCAVVFRLRVHGRENVPRGGAYILAGNHQSYLDPVFCGVGIRRRLCFVARDSLFRSRPFAWLIRSLDAIPIGRGTADIAAMKMIIARLQQGDAVCLYPEATRTHDGRIIPFKAVEGGSGPGPGRRRFRMLAPPQEVLRPRPGDHLVRPDLGRRDDSHHDQRGTGRTPHRHLAPNAARLSPEARQATLRLRHPARRGRVIVHLTRPPIGSVWRKSLRSMGIPPMSGLPNATYRVWGPSTTAVPAVTRKLALFVPPFFNRLLTTDYRLIGFVSPVLLPRSIRRNSLFARHLSSKSPPRKLALFGAEAHGPEWRVRLLTPDP